jgi:hypothetical protein
VTFVLYTHIPALIHFYARFLRKFESSKKGLRLLFCFSYLLFVSMIIGKSFIYELHFENCCSVITSKFIL